jgi:hypothetical protein
MKSGQFVIRTTILWVVTSCSSVKPDILEEHLSSVFTSYFLVSSSTYSSAPKIVAYDSPEYQAFSELLSIRIQKASVKDLIPNTVYNSFRLL